jgi:hypothetical protein
MSNLLAGVKYWGQLVQSGMPNAQAANLANAKYGTNISPGNGNLLDKIGSAVAIGGFQASASLLGLGGPAKALVSGLQKSAALPTTPGLDPVSNSVSSSVPLTKLKLGNNLAAGQIAVNNNPGAITTPGALTTQPQTFLQWLQSFLSQIF